MKKLQSRDGERTDKLRSLCRISIETNDLGRHNEEDVSEGGCEERGREQRGRRRRRYGRWRNTPKSLLLSIQGLVNINTALTPPPRRDLKMVDEICNKKKYRVRLAVKKRQQGKLLARNDIPRSSPLAASRKGWEGIFSLFVPWLKNKTPVNTKWGPFIQHRRRRVVPFVDFLTQNIDIKVLFLGGWREVNLFGWKEGNIFFSSEWITIQQQPTVSNLPVSVFLC